MAAILENGCHKKQLIPWAEKRIIIDDPTSPRSLALGLAISGITLTILLTVWAASSSSRLESKSLMQRSAFSRRQSWVGVVCEQAYVRAWNIDVIDGKAFIIGVKGRASLMQTETRERYPRGCEDARILNVTSLFTSRETTATRVKLTIDKAYKYCERKKNLLFITSALNFSLSVQMKQHGGMLVNCLFVTVVWTFESIFLETAFLKFGIACQQQYIWKTLPVCESLNPLLSVLTCRSM